MELWNGQSFPLKCSAPQEVILCVVVAASTEDPLASAVSGKLVFLPFVPELQVDSQIHLILVEAGNPGLGLSSSDSLYTAVLCSSETGWLVS